MKPKNTLCIFFVLTLWMWGCDSNSPDIPHTVIKPLSKAVGVGACQRILEGEDTIPMRGMVYDSRKNIVTGTIPETAFRCSYGEITLNMEGSFRILGECGQAPGRIQSIVNEVSCGDGFVYVRDMAARIQVFDSDGGYAGALRGIRPYQINFKISEDRVLAAGISRNGYIVVTEYNIGEDNELTVVRDVAIIRDWRNHIANKEVTPKEVVVPSHFEWIGNKSLFVGSGLWGQYILVDLSTGNWQYENIYLSEKMAKTLPNRNVANYMCAFEMDGKIALVEPVHKAIQINGRRVESYYVVDIQDPSKGTTQTFNPLIAGCSEGFSAINAFDAVFVGSRNFIAMEYIKKGKGSGLQVQYTRYKIPLFSDK